MTPEALQFWTAAVPTIGGVLYALLPVLDRWFHRRALLAAADRKDPELVRALESTSRPPPMPGGGAAVMLLIAAAFAFLSLYARDPEVAAVGPRQGRGCSTAAECDPGQRCEAGRCVADAHKGQKKRPFPRPAPSAYDADLALWWRSPNDRRDPLAPPLQISARTF